MCTNHKLCKSNSKTQIRFINGNWRDLLNSNEFWFWRNLIIKWTSLCFYNWHLTLFYSTKLLWMEQIHTYICLVRIANSSSREWRETKQKKAEFRDNHKKDNEESFYFSRHSLCMYVRWRKVFPCNTTNSRIVFSKLSTFSLFQLFFTITNSNKFDRKLLILLASHSKSVDGWGFNICGLTGCHRHTHTSYCGLKRMRVLGMGAFFPRT